LICRDGSAWTFSLSAAVVVVDRGSRLILLFSAFSIFEAPLFHPGVAVATAVIGGYFSGTGFLRGFV